MKAFDKGLTAIILAQCSRSKSVFPSKKFVLNLLSILTNFCVFGICQEGPLISAHCSIDCGVGSGL